MRGTAPTGEVDGELFFGEETLEPLEAGTFKGVVIFRASRDLTRPNLKKGFFQKSRTVEVQEE